MTKGLVEDKFCLCRDCLMGWDLNKASPDTLISIREGFVEMVRLVWSV